jgi:hypothetical protein
MKKILTKTQRLMQKQNHQELNWALGFHFVFENLKTQLQAIT